MSKPIGNSEQPIAWLEEKGDVETNSFWYEVRNYAKEGCIPVYIHPQRELTDQEIMVEARLSLGDAIDNIDDIWVLLFARAIIKASRGEK
jgi:hypothetical protein